MPATQSTSLAGTVYQKVIESLIAAYQYDGLTCSPFFRFMSIAEEATATAGFPRWVKNSVGAVATETTTLATTELQTTNVDITVSRYGIAREITNTLLDDSIVGRAMWINDLVMDAAILFGEQLETDATALFSSITSSAGTTGTALSISTMVTAMATMRANKAKGDMVVHLHDLQLKQLQQAQIAATATPWAAFFAPNADGSQFGGYFMGAPVWSSSKNPTANAAADRVGCIFVNGRTSPQFCAFAHVSKRTPSSLMVENPLSDSKTWASYARWGVGIPANNFAVKLISQNS